MAPLTEQTLSTLRSTVDAACYDHSKGIPGATVVVVNKDGDELFAHASGRRGMASAEDDAGQRVLKKDGTFEEKKKQITLRMLLTHTAGFGYSFFNVRLRDWGLPAGIDEFSGRYEDMISPLLFQPGEGWEYGVGIDWAGIALERVTGQKLNDYMKKSIFEPLGIKNMSMIPTPEMKSKMAYMNHRESDGTLRPRDHLARLPAAVSSKEEAERCFNSGGGGMFAQPREYCKILAVLLNDGRCPKTGAEILKPSTITEMFTNQIPDFPDFGRQPIPAAKPDQTNPIPELYPLPGNPPQGWGLTFMISGGGATDRENGVAGIVATQILPFADFPVLKLWADIEKEVYVGMHAASSGK
ncbi:hypothetical protein INS49_013194 [Diaporthe citri]|uniref:uncharacterized protein n=1 Tax=Diaporthe citri TaxID=83186 RepID=UPI001C7EE28F|nr:uncharacterized protein INS49_013194 [Diaporthe citri]KAG6359671.1 hypothetical protein INS49_013194 [Diaporthe citri]